MKKKVLKSPSLSEASKIPPKLAVFVSEKKHWSRGVIVPGLLSFVMTIFIIKYTPTILHNLSHISFPTVSMLFSKKRERKIVFTGNEHFTTIDPMLLKGYIDEHTKKIAIIDTRSSAEFANGHIKGAISSPLYTDFRKPYESVISISEWMGAVKKQSRGASEIILYSYHPDADILRVAADTLQKKDIKAKILSVGYADWQNGFWNWMAGGDLNGMVNINDYIEKTQK